MTERGRGQVERSHDMLSVGPSAMRWNGDHLAIEIAEVSCPIPRKVAGTVRLYPQAIGSTAFALDEGGRHVWHPIAPKARVEVEMTSPAIRWTGSGYFDSNFGTEPLEAGFRDWHWSRAHLRDDVTVIYEGARRDGSDFAMALRFDREGVWHDTPLPPSAGLRRSGFGIERRTRGLRPHVVETWIDAPFYARSALSTEIYGERVDAVHESLSMDRFVSPLTQFMLPFRMPRGLR